MACCLIGFETRGGAPPRPSRSELCSSPPASAGEREEFTANSRRPHPEIRMGPLSLDVSCLMAAGRSGRDARGLFHDRKADAGLVTVLFRNRAPGILGFLAGRKRTLHLGRAFHELVEVHRSELAANHPEIALRHD